MRARKIAFCVKRKINGSYVPCFATYRYSSADALREYIAAYGSLIEHDQKVFVEAEESGCIHVYNVRAAVAVVITQPITFERVD